MSHSKLFFFFLREKISFIFVCCPRLKFLFKAPLKKNTLRDGILLREKREEQNSATDNPAVSLIVVVAFFSRREQFCVVKERER